LLYICIYYEKVFLKIFEKLNLISLKYNLFISTDIENKKNNVEKILLNSTVNKFEIIIYKNKGRDIYPFLK